MQVRTAGQRLPHRPVLDDTTVVVPTLGRTLIAGCLRSINQCVIGLNRRGEYSRFATRSEK